MPLALIVEDEKKMREMCKKLLVQEGFDVLEAENGEEGGMKLMTEDRIDLVLLDVRMPVVSGSTLFDLIKSYHPYAKVIVTSVYPLDIQKHLIDTADGYFDKSQGIKSLLSKVRGVLEENQKAGGR